MSFRETFLTAVLVALAISGCAGSLNRKEAQIHFETAQRFDRQGDFTSAKEHYAKALVNARLAKADSATLSMLTYNYGRTAGYTCQLAEAEKHLLEALEMEKSISGPESSISTMRLFELGRFYFDQAKYEKSVSFYAKGIPAVEKLGISHSDPIGFADALDEYSTALAQSGKTAEASTAKQQANQLREKNKGAKAGFVPVRYKC